MIKLKKLLSNLIALILIAVCVSVLDHCFAPKYLDENQDGRITREFYNEKTQLDVIALGSSTMYNAFSPVRLWEKYGITSYVRSNASQTLWQSYYLLKDALKYKKPSLVVLDVSFIKYGEEFIEEPSNRKTIESMRDPIAKYGAIKASMYSEEDPLSYYFPILRYHSRWKELDFSDMKYSYKTPDVTYDGFLMEFSVPEEQNIYSPEDIDGCEFPPKAIEYLDKIIALCEKENIPLLLMKTPTYVNSWHKEYDEIISDYAEEKGISYVNFDEYAEDMDINVRIDYIDDGSHMNVVGAEKFTDEIGAYITERYALADYSQDAEVTNVWNEKLLKYNNDKATGMKEYHKLLEKYDLLD